MPCPHRTGEHECARRAECERQGPPDESVEKGVPGDEQLKLPPLGALDAASRISFSCSSPIGSGLNFRMARWENIASPIGMFSSAGGRSRT